MIQNHFSNRFTSPLNSIVIGYVYIGFLGIFMFFSGFYQNSSFFSYGIPVTFMGTTIDDEHTYYTILVLFFVHQVINNLINDVTYPWIINCIQDPKCHDIVYSKRTSMIIVNLFALYSELDMILIISGVMSQITFFLMIICANMLSVTIVNWQYIKDKQNRQDSSYDPFAAYTIV